VKELRIVCRQLEVFSLLPEVIQLLPYLESLWLYKDENWGNIPMWPQCLRPIHLNRLPQLRSVTFNLGYGRFPFQQDSSEWFRCCDWLEDWLVQVVEMAPALQVLDFQWDFELEKSDDAFPTIPDEILDHPTLEKLRWTGGIDTRFGRMESTVGVNIMPKCRVCLINASNWIWKDNSFLPRPRESVSAW
jgi:hypothetical protein